MCLRLRDGRVKILPIQVNSVPILASADEEAMRVQAGAHPKREIVRPVVVFQQLFGSQGPRRFVPMYSGGNINAERTFDLGGRTNQGQ
jgi:hypothetical protein